jgi:hypothetical protein
MLHRQPPLKLLMWGSGWRDWDRGSGGERITLGGCGADTASSGAAAEVTSAVMSVVASQYRDSIHEHKLGAGHRTAPAISDS